MIDDISGLHPSLDQGPQWLAERLIACHPDDTATAYEAAAAMLDIGDVRSVSINNSLPPGTLCFLPPLHEPTVTLPQSHQLNPKPGTAT